ncbi:ethanolamine ammonia-lyase subunit EutC [Abyssibacter sp.]|uniref:ethanolamine ammonia-lyase subunit EutC n=1 Tax=Abyssibacter sp. TaxID=2320200 RepID=UPI000C67033E|nr:ethanolamine ammonia-lyase [Xanthomonadales bacterium]
MSRLPDTNLAAADDLRRLRERTPARIALGRSGVSLPSASVLAFNQAHALARDAVHAELDVAALATQCRAQDLNVLPVASQAENRAAYLARPDWGRRLDAGSRQRLCAAALPDTDLVIVVSDGLSAVAVQRHALAVVCGLRDTLTDLSIAPIVVARQARVALADEAGECLAARVALSLIGERPGLSAPDSLGAYLTYAPAVGRTDAQRYCVSNIRPEGLPVTDAIDLLTRLIRRSLSEQRSGVDVAARLP